MKARAQQDKYLKYDAWRIVNNISNFFVHVPSMTHYIFFYIVCGLGGMPLRSDKVNHSDLSYRFCKFLKHNENV